MERDKIKYLFQISVLFAITYAICLYKNDSGIGFTVFGVVNSIILFSIIKRRNIHINGWHIFYGLGEIVLSTIPMLFTNEFCVFVSKLLYIILMIKWVITIYFRIEKLEFVRNISIFFIFILESIGQILAPFSDINILMSKENDGERKENHTGEKENISMPDILVRNTPMHDTMTPKSKFSQIVIGIVLAAPILFVVLLLLMSADVVFRKVIVNIVINLFMGVDNVIAMIKWFITFALAFIAAYGLGRVLLIKRLKTEPVIQNKIDNVIGVTFTSIFAFVYAVFCLIQIVALLNTSGSILPSGVTYASYARQGFFQLLFVCIINIIMVLVCKLKFEDGRAFRKIMMVICGCTYIMTGSSAYRMILYIRIYQLTFLRVLVLWALLVIAVTMSFVTVFIYKENIPLFEYLLISITVLFIAFAFMSPDRIIAKYNISHMNKNSNNDINYLINELTEDAAVIIIENIDKIESNMNKDDNRNYNKDWAVRYCEKISDKYEEKYDEDIRSFNVSGYIAYIKAKEYLNN